MNTTTNPVRTTIIFGFLSALTFIPLVMLTSPFIGWPQAVQWIIFLDLTVYAYLLARWSRTPFRPNVFPLSVLLLLIIIGNPLSTFFFIAIGFLAWIRSGICFQNQGAMKIGAELIVSLGGAMLVFIFTPYRTMEWAVGVWLFFLVQSLYFLLSDITDSDASDFNEIDPFDRAKKTAEDILSGS